MLRIISFGLSLLVGSVTGCTGNDNTGASNAGALLGASGGTTSAGTHPSGGSISTGGGSGMGASVDAGFDDRVTAGCEVWPINKMFPFIGTLFYGPDPGPCSMTTLNGPTLSYTYDDAKLPAKAESADGTSTMSLTYDGDRLTQEVDTNPTAQTTFRMEYGSNTVSYTQSNPSSNVPTFTVIYQLDSRGYPRVALTTGTLPSNWAVRYEYVYNGCQMQARIAHNADGTENAGSTLYYSFDTVGHFVRQVSATGSVDTSFDYSCWTH